MENDVAERNINQVKKVKEISGDLPSIPDEVNRHLDEGWILVGYRVESVDSDHGPSQFGVYVLGSTKVGDDRPVAFEIVNPPSP